MNKAILNIFFFAFLMMQVSCLFSQNTKIDQARTHFITQKVNLSEKEAEKFWPVYNEYLDKMKALRTERKNLYSRFYFGANAAESEEFIRKKILLDITEKQIIMDYTERFKKILGVVKTAMFLKAEEEFRLELLKILKDKQE